MTKHNDFTFDIHLNAKTIEMYIESASEFIETNLPLLHRDTHLTPSAEKVATALDEAAVRCGNICYMSEQLQESATRKMLSSVEKLAHFAIKEAQRQGRPIACVLAPMFDENNRADGYIRRIENVDSLFPYGTFCFYVYYNECAPWPNIELLDDDRALLTYNDPAPMQRILDNIVRNSGVIYCHSIYRFEDHLANIEITGEFFLDFHGAVPEEIHCLTGDYKKSQEFECIERATVNIATTIIAVSNSMVSHIKQKYPEETRDTHFIVMPIFDTDLYSSNRTQSRSSGDISIVYAGGMQTWQLFDEMIDAIKSQENIATYDLFVPNIDLFHQKYEQDKDLSKVRVRNVSPHELRDIYKSSDFGFILRDESVVNKVACPTKLTEYLASGVVPIVKFPDIGDFQHDGYSYVKLSDFLEGHLPSVLEQQKMAANNQRILKLQLERFTQGKEQLQKKLYCVLKRSIRGKRRLIFHARLLKNRLTKMR